ncbi:restriction endonuclease subunit S [Corynebacterium diphtheriae]|nr:restriction endonuclease subunit S [Corynebacterium diphtheriae]
MSWEAMKLGDVLPFKYGRNLPESKRTQTGEYDVVTSAGVAGSHCEALTTVPSVVVGRKGTIGKLTYCDAPVWPTDTAFFVEERDGVNLRFAYYLLSTLPFQSMNNDSAVPGLNRRDAEDLIVRIPSLQEQNSIADVLGALDDKIAANQQVIQIVDELLASVAKRTFLTTGSQILLSDVVDLHYGKSLPVERRVDGAIPVVGSGGISGTHNEALIRDSTIVIGRKGTIGSVRWIEGPSFPIDTTYWVTSKELPLEFVYQLLKAVDFAALNTDSAVPGLNRHNALAQSVPEVSLAEGIRFKELTEPFRQRAQMAIVENKTLAQARDELLPLLMNGKITIAEAKDEVEALGVDKHSEGAGHV